MRHERHEEAEHFEAAKARPSIIKSYYRNRHRELQSSGL